MRIDERGSSVERVDLVTLAEMSDPGGAAWAFAGEELNANLVLFRDGSGIEEHVNDDVEVLLVGIEGIGRVEIDGERYTLQTGQMIVVPKGARRSIRAGNGRFAYLTCHRRKGGLTIQIPPE